MVHSQKQEWSEARQCFENAVAINPGHVNSLVQLGSIEYMLYNFNRECMIFIYLYLYII